jgi:hypothetical protein
MCGCIMCGLYKQLPFPCVICYQPLGLLAGCQCCLFSGQTSEESNFHCSSSLVKLYNIADEYNLAGVA